MREARRSKWAARAMAVALAGGVIIGGTAVSVPLISQAEGNSVLIDGQHTTGSITIKKTDDDSKPLAGAKYSIYKIMSLTPGNQQGTYAGYEMVDTYEAALAGVTPDALGNYSAARIEDLAADLKAVALEDGATAATGVTAADTGEVTFSGLALGYYLVVETEAPDGYTAGEAFLIAVPSTDNYNAATPAAGTEWVYDVVAQPKNSQVGITKDFAAAEAGAEQDGSVKVGDYVKYQIETEIPAYDKEYFENGNTVTFQITDVMSDGLAIQKEGAYAAVVKVDNLPITAGETTYTLTAENRTGTDADLTIDFDSDYIKDNGGKSVIVTYYALVTDQAVTGMTGNPNKAALTYNNKPGTGSTGRKETEELKVYSFNLNVVKFTKEDTQQPLSGAEFELYQDSLDGTAIITLSTGTDGIISFAKLDEGTYYLKETKAPQGYTLLANPVKVEIIANKDGEGKATGTFALKVDDKEITAQSGDYVTRLDQNTGTAIVAVENHKGFTLPSTGGMGIFVFLAIGVVGILTVSVVIIRKTKKNQ